MDKEIVQKLKRLSVIKPEQDYILKSRRLILAVPPARPALITSGAWIGIFAVIILIIISSFTGNLFSKSGHISLFDSEEIKNEFENLTISLQLEQITYQQNVNDVIASALNEIGDLNLYRTNPSLLEKELNSFNLNGDLEKQRQIDNLLEKVIN